MNGLTQNLHIWYVCPEWATEIEKYKIVIYTSGFRLSVITLEPFELETSCLECGCLMSSRTSSQTNCMFLLPVSGGLVCGGWVGSQYCRLFRWTVFEDSPIYQLRGKRCGVNSCHCRGIFCALL